MLAAEKQLVPPEIVDTSAIQIKNTGHNQVFQNIIPPFTRAPSQ